MLVAACNATSTPAGAPATNVAATANYELLPGAQTGLEHMPLTISSASGIHRFDVELAATPEQQRTGMMFRRNVPPNAGMLFPYDPPQYAMFWMKNTYASLDLVFIGEDRRIGSIVANAVPMSTDFMMAEAPVIAVLEIRGGRAAELGIKVGDRVDW